MAHGDIARKLCDHIDVMRRQGNTTALLEAPAVKDGRARMVVVTLQEATHIRNQCPKVNLVSLFSLDRLRGWNGPVVIDLAAVYVALKDALARDDGNPNTKLAGILRPYGRVLTPDPKGGYTATIREFPGCVAEGDTADEAMKNLERAAEAWLEAALAQNFKFPLPGGKPPTRTTGSSKKTTRKTPTRTRKGP